MTVFRVEKTKDFTVMTALQLIAEASRCPVYELERILALMEKLGINEKGFALLMNVAPFTVRLWTSGASQPSGNENGYKTHTGGKFTSTIVNCILKDRFYCGYQEDGTTTEALQALRIRSDETYAQILEILGQRNNANEEKRHIALQTKGQAMLSGNIFCAHCGGRLTTIRYRDHYTRADGSEYSVDQIKYSCYHKSRKLCKCDGQTTYQADRVDEIIRQIFSCMSGAPEEEKLQALLKRQIAGNKARQTQLEHELGKSREQLTKLQLEIAKTLTDESVYSPEDLTQVLRTVKENIANGEQELAKLKEEEAQKM